MANLIFSILTTNAPHPFPLPQGTGCEGAVIRPIRDAGTTEFPLPPPAFRILSSPQRKEGRESFETTGVSGVVPFSEIPVPDKPFEGEWEWDNE